MGKGRGYAGGMPGGMNMNNLLKQAQKMQRQMPLPSWPDISNLQ